MGFKSFQIPFHGTNESELERLLDRRDFLSLDRDRLLLSRDRLLLLDRRLLCFLELLLSRSRSRSFSRSSFLTSRAFSSRCFSASDDFARFARLYCLSSSSSMSIFSGVTSPSRLRYCFGVLPIRNSVRQSKSD